MKSGIYKITNKIDNKVYVGQSYDIENRFKDHIKNLNNNRHHNQHLQNSWNKYGIDSFIFESLLLCPESCLNYWEDFWIEKYQSYNREFGYNIIKRSYGPGRHIKETKDKISKSNKGKGCKYFSCEHKKKISEALKGKIKEPRSEEIKKKISDNRKGKGIGNKLSEDTKKKMSASRTGKIASQEARINMSDAQKGHSVSDETKKKISESLKGNTSPRKGVILSEETKKKISESRKGKTGRKHSEETKKKISEKAKKRHKYARDSHIHRGEV